MKTRLLHIVRLFVGPLWRHGLPMVRGLALVAGWLFALLWPASALGPKHGTAFDLLTRQLAHVFAQRMADFDPTPLVPLPPVLFDAHVSANAIWWRDTIRLGPSFYTQTFLNDEDRLSILYHEYQHRVNEHLRRFPCTRDLSGHIVQLETPITYQRELTHAEIEEDYLQVVNDRLSAKEKLELWISLSKPDVVQFQYAPSNLSRDELFCYRAEQQAAKAGIFRHSTAYADYLHYRILREQHCLHLRTEFERHNKLLPDGTAR